MNLGCVCVACIFPAHFLVYILVFMLFFQGKKTKQLATDGTASGLVRILPATVKDPSFFYVRSGSTCLDFMTHSDAKIHGYEINRSYSASPTGEFHCRPRANILNCPRFRRRSILNEDWNFRPTSQFILGSCQALAKFSTCQTQQATRALFPPRGPRQDAD